ncbi:transporter substrate-binding domain-containing protein [Maridesulfovibrio sp.]|uniref:transporter substrate-binding domain-containing protein n=1 Tax=Maridesulfovibrio sp. TaxID=2795000 RepID=UPI002A188CCD|nr:transporter substrate-binding domain-containing protein [Maridesulfovibrio sp.]
MNLWRILSVSIAIAILTVSLTFPVMADDIGRDFSKGDTLEKILQRETIRVGISIFEPWVMQDQNGQYVGFEIDVAKRLAADMGVKVDFVPTDWDTIIPALIEHEFDIIICGMNMTPERILKVNFSDPYEFNSMSIVANKNVKTGKMTRADYNNAKVGPSHLSALEDFNSPRIRIGVRTGTTAVNAVKNYTPKAEAVLFKDEETSIKALLNGEVCCLMLSQPLPQILAEKYPKKLYLPMESGFAWEPSGFVVRKGDHDFLTYLNNWIRICDSDGWLKTRYHYWFKSYPWKTQIK